MAQGAGDPPAAARCAEGFAAGSLESGVVTAVRSALDALGTAQPTLAVVFVSAPGDPDAGGRALGHAGALLREEHPDCSVIGTSAHGVIGQGRAVELEPAISVWIAAIPGPRPRPFRIATVPSPAGDLALTGLPERRPDDRVAVLLADPWSAPVRDILVAFEGIDGALPVVGGLASGGQQRGEMRLLLDGAVLDSGAVGVILGGDAPVRAVVSQGCRPIGPPMIVTRSEESLLLELAGEPALTRVRSIVEALPLEEQALAVRGLQMGVARAAEAGGEDAGDFLMRGIVGADPQRGALAIGEQLPMGTLVRLHLRDADSADDDLREVVGAIDTGVPPAGILMVTCNGRGRAMFTTPAHDVDVVRSILGLVPTAGFFAAGEIGPVGGTNHIHGFTAVLLVVDALPSGSSVEVERERVGGAPMTEAEADDLDAELAALLQAPEEG